MGTEVRVRLLYGTEEVWGEVDDGVHFDYTVRSDGFLVVHSTHPGQDEWGSPRPVQRREAVYPPGGWCRVTGGAQAESRSPGVHAVIEVKREARS